MIKRLLRKYSELQLALVIMILISLTAFNCDKDVTVSPPPSPIPKGFLMVRSVPEGSTIFLNGRNTGRVTPDSLIYLNYGNYEVTLKRKYWRDTSIYVNIGEGIKVDTSVNYLSNPLMFGSLNVTSSPSNSLIYINDSLTAFSTPAIINQLIPGLYAIKLKKTGFRDGVLNNVEVESNVVKAVYSQLSDTTVWVDFQVSNSNIPTNVLSCITIDHNGIKWMGTFEYGLLKFDGSNFTAYNKNNSPLPDNHIICLSVDTFNKLWIGTDNGLAVLDNGSWNVFTKVNSGLPINSIRSLASENNLMWIGTSLGLVKYDGNWQVYIVNPNITNWVTTISVDQANTKWLGISDTSMGIVSFDGFNFTDYQIEVYGYPTNNVVCSAVSPSGQVWFGCNPVQNVPGGLTYFDGNSFTNINLAASSLINHIFISSQNVKWISTDVGIYKIVGTSQISHYTTTNSPLTSNDIKGTFEDNEGTLWIATGTGGLVKFKGAN